MTASGISAQSGSPPAEIWYVMERHAPRASRIVSVLYETREQAADFLAVIRERHPKGDYSLFWGRSTDAHPQWALPVYMRNGSVIPARELWS